jgi:hypothetical protein
MGWYWRRLRGEEAGKDEIRDSKCEIRDATFDAEK